VYTFPSSGAYSVINTHNFSELELELVFLGTLREKVVHLPLFPDGRSHWLMTEPCPLLKRQRTGS
jgi:hypothetical protein